MKISWRIALIAVLAVFCANASGKEALLLLHHVDHFVVARYTDAGVGEIAVLGEQAIYARSETSFAILSNKPLQGQAWRVEILDKSTALPIASYPIHGDVMALPSGPSENAVLTDDAVYFPVRRSSANGNSVTLNELGSDVDLHRIALANGKETVLAFPRDAPPRLFKSGGLPIVTGQYAIWRINGQRGVLEPLGGAEIEQSAAPGSIGKYVAVPGHGVLRMSRAGELQQVLQSDLSAVSRARPSALLSGAAVVVAVFPGNYGSAPAVGLVFRSSGRLFLGYADPQSVAMIWQHAIPLTALPGSLFSASDGSVFFVEPSAAAIEQLSRKGVSVAWKLNESAEELRYARVLSVVSARQ